MKVFKKVPTQVAVKVQKFEQAQLKKLPEQLSKPLTQEYEKRTGTKDAFSVKLKLPRLEMRPKEPVFQTAISGIAKLSSDE